MIADDPIRISIVATVRNEEKNIDEFLVSLLEQTRRADEIIIVDGASTDGTLEILKQYADRGSIRLISRHCNIAQGRNLEYRRGRDRLYCGDRCRLQGR